MSQQEMVTTLIKGDKVADNTDYRDALSVNCSAVLRPILGAQGYMLEQPGLTQYGEGEGIDRGGVWNDRMGILFRVSGSSLITVTAAGVVTVLATSPAPVTSARAAMPYSFISQAIVIDGRYFRYTVADGVQEIVDPDLGEPLDCVWVDGYYFFTDGEYLFHTVLADETQIDPLQFATSEFSPDPTIGVSLTTDDKVIAWNRYTTEYFANVANEFFAFTRIPSRTVQFGLVGTHCKAQIGGEWFFMGGAKETNVSIFQLGVGTAKNISTREVDKLIKQYTDEELSACVLDTRVIDTYPYLLVYLPNETLECNLQIAGSIGPDQAWSILKSGTGNVPYRAINGVFDPRIPAWVYGDSLGATLGYLDETVATHYEAMVECVLFTPFIYLETASVDQLEIETIPGFTVTDDASVFLALTYDGLSYSGEASMQYGAPAAYTQRFLARKLGYISNWFSLRLRWVSRSRMAFATTKLLYG